MKFQQGLSNKTIIKNNLVIKKINHDNDKFLKRENEIIVLKILQQARIKFYLKHKISWQEKQMFLITKKQKHLQFLNKKNLNHKKLYLLAKTLKKLHQITFFKIKKFDLWANLAILEQESKQFIDDLTLLKKEVKLILKDLPKFNFVLCHNDLVINNLLFKKKSLILNDYEFACLNDYLFDVASFISETLTTLITNKNQKRALINYWCQQFDLDSKQIEIVYKYTIYQNLYNCYWANFMFAQKKKQIFSDIFYQKYQKLQKQLNSYKDKIRKYEW